MTRGHVACHGPEGLPGTLSVYATPCCSHSEPSWHEQFYSLLPRSQASQSGRFNNLLPVPYVSLSATFGAAIFLFFALSFNGVQ